MRSLATTPNRRRQVLDQLPYFAKRIRLSQRSLEMLYLAILCFVMTSLHLAATQWVSASTLPSMSAAVFAIGVVLVIAALGLEFVEMRSGLKTNEIETRDTVDYR